MRSRMLMMEHTEKTAVLAYLDALVKLGRDRTPAEVAVALRRGDHRDPGVMREMYLDGKITVRR